MDPQKNPAFALAAGLFHANRLVTIFMREHVRRWMPADDVKDDAGAAMYGQLLRVDAWLRTLTKLDDPADFQAVAAACRGMLESTIDMVLLLQRPGDFQRLLDWEESAKLKHAQCIGRFFERWSGTKPEEHQIHIAEWAQKHQGRIEALRIKNGWVERRKREQSPATPANPVAVPEQRGRHPDRWTDRNLGDDAREADKQGLAFQFERFYETEYRQLCWMVHGSAFAMREVGPEGFAGLAGLVFPRCSDLGMTAAEVLLRRFERWGEEQARAFAELRDQRTMVAAAVRASKLGEPLL